MCGACATASRGFLTCIRRSVQAKERCNTAQCLRIQTEISASYRAALVDWLVEVHQKFSLSADTLHLCITVVDRYMQTTLVRRDRLQLVGVTALLIASKYEDTIPPAIRDLVSVAARVFTGADVVAMEGAMIASLRYQVSFPTPRTFLQRYLCVIDAELLLALHAEYFLERMLQEYSMCGGGERQYTPSVLASSALLLARKARSPASQWVRVVRIALLSH